MFALGIKATEVAENTGSVPCLARQGKGKDAAGGQIGRKDGSMTSRQRSFVHNPERGANGKGKTTGRDQSEEAVFGYTLNFSTNPVGR